MASSRAFVRTHVDEALAGARLAQSLTSVAYILPSLWEDAAMAYCTCGEAASEMNLLPRRAELGLKPRPRICPSQLHFQGEV